MLYNINKSHTISTKKEEHLALMLFFLFISAKLSCFLLFFNQQFLQ